MLQICSLLAPSWSGFGHLAAAGIDLERFLCQDDGLGALPSSVSGGGRPSQFSVLRPEALHIPLLKSFRRSPQNISFLYVFVALGVRWDRPCSPNEPLGTRKKDLMPPRWPQRGSGSSKVTSLSPQWLPKVPDWASLVTRRTPNGVQRSPWRAFSLDFGVHGAHFMRFPAAVVTYLSLLLSRVFCVTFPTY